MVARIGVVGHYYLEPVVPARVGVAAGAPVLPRAHLVAGSLRPLLVVVQAHGRRPVLLQGKVALRICDSAQRCYSANYERFNHEEFGAQFMNCLRSFPDIIYLITFQRTLN